MSVDFQPSSFIPKKTGQTQTLSTGASVKGKRVNALMLIAGGIFVLTLIGAASVFVYERYLISSLSKQRDSLERARDAFEPRLIEELSRVDLRLSVAEELLQNHITVTPLFELLSDLTLKTVRFEEFEFTRSVDGLVQVKMDGVAQSYRSIALQSELFGDNEYLQSPVFSEFKLDDFGNVAFSVTLSVSNELLLYASRF